ncbi:hypothetical protein ABPG74_006121 [Tetrahymena malaccensis]
MNSNDNIISQSESIIQSTPLQIVSSFSSIQNSLIKIDTQEQQDEQNNQSTQNSSNESDQQSICQFKNISQFFKQPNQLNIFLMYGDLLLETRKNYYDPDYTLQICNTYLQKKRVIEVKYDKNAHLIEMQSENLFSGSTDFKYVYEILMKSQSSQNYALAQQLFLYEQKIIEQRINYERFFMENDPELIYQAQQDFFQKMKYDFKQNLMKNDHEFYSYLFYSYIDQLELGFPIQKEQGINEAVGALFGCDQFQVVELMQRYGFIEHIFKRGFPKEMQDHEPYGHFFMLQNLDYFVKLTDIFDEQLTVMTVDGIHFKMRMVLKQMTQLYKGMIISNFYYSQYLIENEELERILSIRYKGTQIISSQNILDLLLSQNIYSIYAKKFGNFITNHKNFEPQLNQDLFPEKTCKYRLVNNQKNNDQAN